MMAAFGSCGKKLEDWEAEAETAEVEEAVATMATAQMTIYQTTTMTATMVMTAASSYAMTFSARETLPLSVVSLLRYVLQTPLFWPGTLSRVRLSQLPCVHN